MRDISMNQLKAVANSQVVKVTDFFSDPVNIFTAHENIGMVSPSTVTKFTVHYNLFGGSIVALHT
jgi:acyl-CoA oxidase